jgi:Flp pilus assembly secretin CpaC
MAEPALSFRSIVALPPRVLQSAMLARSLLLILPWVAFAPSAHSQAADPQIAFHLRFLKLDPSAEAAITPYLRSATTTDGISVVPLQAGVNPSDLIPLAAAAGSLETLAEPNLVESAGQEATFLAGSSFPVPEVESGSGNATVNWQEFGLRLNLRPTVNADGIGVKVVSETTFMDFKRSVTVQGFTVPAFSKRRNTSQLDLASGQTFVISGLVDRDLTEALSKVPGLADMPLLRSIATSGGTKVLVLVTTELRERLAGPRRGEL